MHDQPAATADRAEWLLLGLFGFLLAAFLFFHAAKPVADTDFWWHLKTGETMVQEKGFLQTDPFALREEVEPTARETLILRSYWLWEVSAYGLYTLFGFKGIVLLNLLTVAALATTLVVVMRRHAIPWGLAAPLITAGLVLFRGYHLERPQVVSFLFAAILLGLLLEVRRGGKLGPALPLVMALWANLHGGFVVGALMLACFAGGALLEYRHDRPRLKALLAWSAAGIGATLLNPAGWLAYREAFTFLGKPLQRVAIEFESTWQQFQQGTTIVAILWGLIALYAAGVCLARRCYWPELLLGLFLAYFSVRYVRNVGFFSLAMLPAIGLAWKEAGARLPRRIPPVVGMIPIALSALLLLWMVANQWKHRDFNTRVAQIYPEAAITFVERSGLQGRMFNDYEYGGYLLWRLAPRIRVFIDGRGIDEEVFDHYNKIRFASSLRVDGRAEFEALLDRYGIDFVMQPIYDGYGNVQPLMKELLNHPGWTPIYLDKMVYILVRDTPGNREVLARHAIAKDEFKNRLFAIYDYLRRTYPEQIGFRIARTGMLIYLGRYDEAKAEIAAMTVEAPGEKMLGNLSLELARLAGRLNR